MCNNLSVCWRSFIKASSSIVANLKAEQITQLQISNHIYQFAVTQTTCMCNYFVLLVWYSHVDDLFNWSVVLLKTTSTFCSSSGNLKQWYWIYMLCISYDYICGALYKRTDMYSKTVQYCTMLKHISLICFPYLSSQNCKQFVCQQVSNVYNNYTTLTINVKHFNNLIFII